MRLVAANAAALILVVLAWYQISGENSIRTQLTWLEVCIGGAVIAAIVDAHWLLRGRRMVNQATAAALEPLRELDLGFDTVDVPRQADAEPVLWVPGTERFHRADCALVAGKDVRVVTAAQRGQLEGCEVCRAR